MPAATKTRLVLFDIDGTLLLSGGAGEKALRDGFRNRFGIDEDLSTIEIAGRTDSGIVQRIFEKHKIESTPQNITAFYDAYLHQLSLELPRHKGVLLPGITELLEKLKTRPEFVIALLTGNLSKGAELKLVHYGIWDFFEFGAYADDHQDRNELGRFASARAKEKHGIEFSGDRIYVLGDTPHDIDCGRAFGAKTVAIATGRYSLEELAAHKPDFLFKDLSDVNNVLAVLGW